MLLRLTMFNGRRGGEPCNVTLAEYEDAVNDAWIDPDVVKHMSEEKKAYLKQYKVSKMMQPTNSTSIIIVYRIRA